MRGVALVEDQVDDGEDGGQPGGQLVARGHLVRQPALADRALGAHEALRDRGLGHEECARDLDRAQPAYQPQREGHAALGGQRRMAAREDQSQPVVGNRLRIDHLGLPRRAERDLVGDRAGAGIGAARAAQAIERAPPRRGQEPRARALGRARRGPAHERLRECLLHDLFGHVDVAHEAQHRRDDARVLDAEDLVDVLVHADIVLPALTSARRAARPRSRPRRWAPSSPTPAPPHAKRTPAGRSPPAPPSSRRRGRR